MKYDPPMSEEERLRMIARWRQRERQASAFTSTGQRKRKRQELNPEARRAQRAVYNAIQKGRLRKPSFCPRCGRGDLQIQFAHNSYGSDGLDGEFMCSSCHVKQDRNNPRGGCR